MKQAARTWPAFASICMLFALLLLLAGSSIVGCNGDEKENGEENNVEPAKEVTGEQPAEHHIYFRNGQIEDDAGETLVGLHVHRNDIVFWHNEESNNIKVNFRPNKKLFGVLRVILYPSEPPLELHIRDNAELGDHLFDPELQTITLPGPKIIVDDDSDD